MAPKQPKSEPPKKSRGNPNFTKGHKFGGRPPGCKNLIRRVGRCADFMDKKGWDELEYIALSRGNKLQLGALQTLAAYGYGQPSKAVEFSGSIDGARSIAELLTDEPTKGEGGTK